MRQGETEGDQEIRNRKEQTKDEPENEKTNKQRNNKDSVGSFDFETRGTLKFGSPRQKEAKQNENQENELLSGDKQKNKKTTGKVPGKAIKEKMKKKQKKQEGKQKYQK